MGIIAISGKINSGKDTVGEIIKYLTSRGKENYKEDYSWSSYLSDTTGDRLMISSDAESIFLNKKFADKLKDIVCLLIECTREQLENEEFKNKELGEEWNKIRLWNRSIGTIGYYDNKKEASHIIAKFNIDNINIDNIITTPKLLLQLLRTECGRNIIHPNIWINSLFNKYKKITVPNRPFHRMELFMEEGEDIRFSKEYPNWIITDLRFENEAQAVLDRKGILIRINREWRKDCFKCIKTIKEQEKMPCTEITCYRQYKPSIHESETALDNYNKFHYTIHNNGTIEELIESVKVILKKEGLL